MGIAGFSGSGKTTLVTQLIPALTARGWSVSTVKHTHHSVLLDRPGDLSRALRAAGAAEVMCASPQRWALLHENRGAPEPRVSELAARMTPVDLLLVEGFKRYGHPKIEVYRPAVGKPLLCHEDPHIMAVASDVPLPGLPVPRLNLNDVPAIADYVAGFLSTPQRHESQP